MNKNLCTRCSKSNECFKPFPHEECADYERKITNAEIIRLFWGMGKKMQQMIIEIMEITQNEHLAERASKTDCEVSKKG